MQTEVSFMNALDQIRQKIRQHHLIDERILVPELINLISLQSTEKKRNCVECN